MHSAAHGYTFLAVFCIKVSTFAVQGETKLIHSQLHLAWTDLLPSTTFSWMVYIKIPGWCLEMYFMPVGGHAARAREIISPRNDRSMQKVGLVANHGRGIYTNKIA